MGIRFAVRLAAGFALASLFSLRLAAQEITPPSNPDPTAQTQPQAPAQGQPAPRPTPAKGTGGQGEVAATSNDRLFFALPNFLTLENGTQVPPMTARQKFAVVFRTSFDYVQYPAYAFLSGISQAENSEPGFGQGAAGYGKRFGAALADGTIESFVTGAILPSLLHQDPRFFRSGKGGFARRASYAVSRILVTRGDSGHAQFNFSEVFGSAMSAGISTYSYHPRSEVVTTPSGVPQFIPSDRTLKNTASVWGSQVGYDAITIVVREFWPDIRRKLSHRHKSGGAGLGGSRP